MSITLKTKHSVTTS